MQCPQCGSAMVAMTGMILTSDPPQTQLHCLRCGNVFGKPHTIPANHCDIDGCGNAADVIITRNGRFVRLCDGCYETASMMTILLPQEDATPCSP